MHGAHLVGDRANTADPRGDVGRFGIVASAEKSLKKTGRLIDLELDIGHALAHQLDIQSTLAFHAGERVYTNRFRSAYAHIRSHSSPAFRNCQAQALKPRKARGTWLSDCPKIRNWLVNEVLLGVSIGPKQP